MLSLAMYTQGSSNWGITNTSEDHQHVIPPVASPSDFSGHQTRNNEQRWQYNENNHRTNQPWSLIGAQVYPRVRYVRHVYLYKYC